MKLDVFMSPTEMVAADTQGRVVAVIDVLRASTTIAVALDNGAKSVIPADSADEVITRSKQFERSEVRLAGERRMLAIPGFDMGNSPVEFTPEAVAGSTVLISTTNGTRAARRAGSARHRHRIVREFVGRFGDAENGREVRPRYFDCLRGH